MKIRSKWKIFWNFFLAKLNKACVRLKDLVKNDPMPVNVLTKIVQSFIFYAAYKSTRFNEWLKQ